MGTLAETVLIDFPSSGKTPLSVTAGILYFCDLGYVVTLKMNPDYERE